MMGATNRSMAGRGRGDPIIIHMGLRTLIRMVRHRRITTTVAIMTIHITEAHHHLTATDRHHTTIIRRCPLRCHLTLAVDPHHRGTTMRHQMGTLTCLAGRDRRLRRIRDMVDTDTRPITIHTTMGTNNIHSLPISRLRRQVRLLKMGTTRARVHQTRIRSARRRAKDRSRRRVARRGRSGQLMVSTMQVQVTAKLEMVPSPKVTRKRRSRFRTPSGIPQARQPWMGTMMTLRMVPRIARRTKGMILCRSILLPRTRGPSPIGRCRHWGVTTQQAAIFSRTP
mmetsp:Transcript_31563/g.76510  ORF Transcript_31563/g.76510 Transcript_31563/m.76510 type:complete len:282 (+) Transcript_31563:1059-1904(+)